MKLIDILVKGLPKSAREAIFRRKIGVAIESALTNQETAVLDAKDKLASIANTVDSETSGEEIVTKLVQCIVDLDAEEQKLAYIKKAKEMLDSDFSEDSED